MIEWWMGDHWPKHAHVYKDGRQIAKVQIPEMRVLDGRLSKRLRKIMNELLRKGLL